MRNSFNKDIIPPNEKERLAAVEKFKMVDVIPEGYFTNLAQIMARTFDAPIGLVSLVDKDSVHFVGNAGMEDTDVVPRGISLCSLAILDQDITVFENAVNEPCLLANPLVAGEFGLKFYAGAPIITHDGYAIGTACIVDKKPRTFEKEDRELLQYFAHIAMEEIELRHKFMVSVSETA